MILSTVYSQTNVTIIVAVHRLMASLSAVSADIDYSEYREIGSAGPGLSDTAMESMVRQALRRKLSRCDHHGVVQCGCVRAPSLSPSSPPPCETAELGLTQLKFAAYAKSLIGYSTNIGRDSVFKSALTAGCQRQAAARNVPFRRALSSSDDESLIRPVGFPLPTIQPYEKWRHHRHCSIR